MKRWSIIVLLALAIASTAASCPNKTHPTPRHDAAQALKIVAVSLGAVQDGERALFLSGKIPAGAYNVTTQKCEASGHRCFSAALATAFKLTDDAVGVVQAWQPGQPVPSQLAALTSAIRTALKDALALSADGSLSANILAAYDAVATLLVVMGGGAL
jgi:hypothetical protein